MKILKVAVGNEEAAFVENELTDGVNIISSDDNNKGKTIVIQSMMYALGNEPVFPKSFEYQDYSYYVEFQIEDNMYYICRKGDSFVMKNGTSLLLFDNTSELKRYWAKNITPLPSIMKKELMRIVDPVLFFQIFFIGQDKKDTSNIAKNGFYNKQDFMEMLYSYAGIEGSSFSQDEIDQTKKRINQLQEEKATLLKQHAILKSKKPAASYLSIASNRSAFGALVAQMEAHKEKIEILEKERNQATNKRLKWEATIKELRSLNRTIECGELRCMDCGSAHITFTSGKGNRNQNAYSFDISTAKLRDEILKSIAEKIESYNEEIEKYSQKIEDEQRKLNALLEKEPVTLENLVIYRNDVFSAKDAEKRIAEIDLQLEEENEKLKANDNAAESATKQRNELYQQIIQKMNFYFHKIDVDGEESYNDLFTDRNTVYSGSEATVFHISKLLALQAALNHDFPIIIDSFRAEDLSTQKENRVIGLFRMLGTQTILSTTLKTEELGKYNDMEGINHIDYLSHQANHLLQPAYVEEMRKLLAVLSLDF